LVTDPPHARTHTPPQGFPDREALAGYLCTLHELAEPQHRRMGGWGETPSMVQAVKWFDDDSPRGEYVRYQHCSLCDGEQPFYNLPLGVSPASRGWGELTNQHIEVPGLGLGLEIIEWTSVAQGPLHAGL